MQLHTKQLNELNNIEASDTVFVFQSNKKLTLEQLLLVENEMQNFAMSWTSHGAKVYTNYTILYGQFLVFIINETQVALGGCSKDSMINFIKKLELQYKLDLLNRQLIAFYKNDKVEILPYQQIAYALSNNIINENTLYFNNLVNTFADLQKHWLIPIKQSWIHQQFSNHTI